MTGVEIDMIVKDSLAALALYESVFDTQRIEVTSFPVGSNEAVFTIYGVRIHLLDENPGYQMFAPVPGHPQSAWLNILVPDIKSVHEKAMAAGCTEIQPVTEIAEMGVMNSVFLDPFGHLWMLHQILRAVSFEQRVAMYEKAMDPVQEESK